MFNETFKDTSEKAFEIKYEQFVKKLPALRSKFNTWNVKKLDDKAKYLDTFSLANWKNLSDIKKREHSLTDCKSCAVRCTTTQALFPIKSNNLKGKGMKNPIYACSRAMEGLRNTVRKVTPTLSDAKKAVKAVFDKIAPTFEECFKTPFTEAISKVSETKLTKRKTPNQIREEKREQIRKTKNSIQKQMEETAFIR